jgi:hypothetical protein
MLVIKINIRTMLWIYIYRCGDMQSLLQIILFMHICLLFSKFQIAYTFLHIEIQLT